MHKKVAKLIKQIEKLSAEEREFLFEALEVLGLIELPVQEGVEEAWDEELERRLKSIDDGTAELIPWEEVKNDISSIIAKHQNS